MDSGNPVTKDRVLHRYADEPLIRRYLPFIEREIIPFDYFHVYRDWLRMRKGMHRLTVLFIAESPPWRGIAGLPTGDVENYRYFYNDACRAPATLRTAILSRLDLTRSIGDDGRLPCFRDHHLFLTDTLKCAIYKDRHPSLPKSLVHAGVQILREEIDWLCPQYIVTMGSTAFAAIREIYPGEFGGYRRLSDVPIGLVQKRILVMPYPNSRNRGNFGDRLESSFSLVNALINQS
ncbi:MAG: uracil-DNA glycosylase family protein [Methanomicrobiales archaeon]|nr:uracil-DNA glycosylase family protein [Methanomicrobiales archaeon]